MIYLLLAILFLVVGVAVFYFGYPQVGWVIVGVAFLVISFILFFREFSNDNLETLGARIGFY